MGIEPTLPGGNRILSPARLPIPPLRPRPDRSLGTDVRPLPELRGRLLRAYPGTSPKRVSLAFWAVCSGYSAGLDDRRLDSRPQELLEPATQPRRHHRAHAGRGGVRLVSRQPDQGTDRRGRGGADRADDREHLCARRTRIHARLRNPRADQLRSRRRVHARWDVRGDLRNRVRAEGRRGGARPPRDRDPPDRDGDLRSAERRDRLSPTGRCGMPLGSLR